MQAELKLGQLISKEITEKPSLETAQCYLDESKVFYANGDFAKAGTLTALAQEQFERFKNAQGLTKTLFLQGQIARDAGHFEIAGQHFDRAQKLAEKLASVDLQSEALNLQASLMSVQGKDHQALNCLKQALSFAQQAHSSEKQISINSNIGQIHYALGDYALALNHLKAAYGLAQALPSPIINEAIVMMNLGLVYQATDDVAKAKSFHSEAWTLAVKLENPAIEIACLNNLAEVHTSSKHIKEAKDFYEYALRKARVLHHKRYMIDNLVGLGNACIELDEYDKAASEFFEAIELSEAIDDAKAKTIALFGLGRVHTKLNSQVARLNFEEALKLAEQLEHPKLIIEAHQLLSEFYEGLGNIAKALFHYKAYHVTDKQVFSEERMKRIQQLSVQFDLERTQHEAETYKLRTNIAQQARHEAEKRVLERTRELEVAHLEIVTRLAIAAEYRDDDTGEHTKRVGRNAAALARALGWADDDVQLLYVAARLHDVGKIGISDTILLKPSKLTEEEYGIVKTHAYIGSRILANGETSLLQLAEQIALHHHERWDGKGYPFGLAGEAIPQAARIVAVADVMDALAHERPYKKAWPMPQIIAEIRSQRGKQFDPEVVAAFEALFGTDSNALYEDIPLEWEDISFDISVLKNTLY